MARRQARGQKKTTRTDVRVVVVGRAHGQRNHRLQVPFGLMPTHHIPRAITGRYLDITPLVRAEGETPKRACEAVTDRFRFVVSRGAISVGMRVALAAQVPVPTIPDRPEQPSTERPNIPALRSRVGIPIGTIHLKTPTTTRISTIGGRRTRRTSARNPRPRKSRRGENNDKRNTSRRSRTGTVTSGTSSHTRRNGSKERWRETRMLAKHP